MTGTAGRRASEVERFGRFLRSLLCAALLLAAAPAGAFAASFYGEVVDGGKTIGAVPLAKVPQRFRRQEVRYAGSEPPGTVVVDLTRRQLFFVLPGGRAMRYGISVGRGAYGWNGVVSVGRKAAWPRWMPTKDMLQRSAGFARYTNGVEPGPLNPLGARALYLYRDGRDTLYRIHGTSEWWSIGDAASSGCIRLLNQDVVDLYARVPVGAKVVVEGSLAAGVLVR